MIALRKDSKKMNVCSRQMPQDLNSFARTAATAAETIAFFLPTRSGRCFNEFGNGSSIFRLLMI